MVQATSLTRPTVHRIVHVLIEEGIVERSDKSGRYAIGGQVPELALARQSRSPSDSASCWSSAPPMRVSGACRPELPVVNDNFSAVSCRPKGLFPRVLARTDARQANASRV